MTKRERTNSLPIANKKLKTTHTRIYKFAQNNSEIIVDITTNLWKFQLDPKLHLNEATMISMVTEHLLNNWDTYKQYITNNDTSVFFQSSKSVDSLTYNEKLLYISDIMQKASWFGNDQNTINNIHKVIFDKMQLDTDIDESALVRAFQNNIKLNNNSVNNLYTEENQEDIQLAINNAIHLHHIIQEIETLKNKPTLEAIIKISNDYPHSIKNL